MINEQLFVKHWITDPSADLPLTICNVANDAKYKWPAFTELLSVVLKYLQDTLELSLTYISMSDSTQLLQW